MKSNFERMMLGLTAISIVGLAMIALSSTSAQLFGIDLIPPWMGHREILVISGIATLIVPWLIKG